MKYLANRSGGQNILHARSAKLWMVLGAVLAVGLSIAVTPIANIKAAQQTEAGMSFIAVSDLPVEARDVLLVIKNRGPFAYERDGATFRNFEQILPKQPRGYYHEYTVKTPGVRNRGARRIVCGPLPECYYSADHYQTFKRIRD